MWNNPSLQINAVGFLRGITAPVIFPPQFALFKMITCFRNRSLGMSLVGDYPN